MLSELCATPSHDIVCSSLSLPLFSLHRNKAAGDTHLATHFQQATLHRVTGKQSGQSCRLAKKPNCISVLPLCGRTGANWQGSELNSFWKSLKTMYDRETCPPVHSRTAVLTPRESQGNLAAVSVSSGPLINVFPLWPPLPNQLAPSALPAVVVDTVMCCSESLLYFL